MRKIIISLLTIFTLLTMIPTTGIANVESSQIVKPDVIKVSQAFDQAIEDIIGAGKSKGAVASLVIDGEEVMTKGYGYADEAFNIKADGSLTGFRIGSISKTFVALAALIAMEDGKIDLNTDISKYLEVDSDFPKLKYPVTMHQLLTHTAGFEDHLTGMAVKNVSDTEPLSVSIRKYMPEQIFKPGETASYSNYGIALAAYVIESATGKDFADFCMYRIFRPLEMNRTTFAHMHNTVYVSHAYLPSGKETLDLYMNLYPEGSAVSTAEDMAKYMKWLLSENESILSQENKEKLFICQYTMADELGGIGYVWNRKTRNNSVYYDKKGETLHFYSRIALFPDHKAGLFLSFNTYVPEEEINAVIAQVTNLLLGEKVKAIRQAGATIDIAGCYANAWSSFKTAEKVLRFFVPDKMIDISGTLSKGYSFNDKKIAHIGANAYETPIGIVKFFEKDGKTLMATDFSQTYIRINGLENKGMTLIITLLFIISSIVYTITAIITRKRKKTTSMLPAIISIIQIAAFFALGTCILIGIMQYAILTYTLYMNIAAWIIVVATIINLMYSLFNRDNIEKAFIKYITLLNNLVSISFCLVLLNLNLLL